MSNPRPAATVVLVRPAPVGFEVFLVRRHDNVAFTGGAHVFPGGRVDDADALAGAVSPFHAAAIRELFEEAGVLLARRDGEFVSIGDEDERFRRYRADLTHRRLTLLDLLEHERLRIADDALAPFANWVTPEVETRRFDTRFFLAVAPDEQSAAHDEHETTEGVWIAPADALARCLRGDIALPPPTWTTLRALSRGVTAEDAWNWARAQRVARVQPCFKEYADGTRLVMLPGDPECPRVEGFEATETRFLLENGRWRPV